MKIKKNILTWTITSPPDRENVVVEIWLDDYQVAELSKEPEDEIKIEIYSPPKGGVWRFKAVDFKRILDDSIIELDK